MPVDLIIMIVAAVAILLLILFLILKNRKDKKRFVNQLKQDYRKPKHTEGDIEVEDRDSV